MSHFTKAEYDLVVISPNRWVQYFSKLFYETDKADGDPIDFSTSNLSKWPPDDIKEIRELIMQLKPEKAARPDAISLIC